ncbi:TonB-dependent receptor [Chitinophaga solisilvae]|uniref:TonB-dependent receptor n=1 Tax=Chitinophaga solisilvae TaxID=1233460 RepID=UPI001367A38D|nr:TonB-dependent receptor [Chitinophaga solisilvae]
MRVSVLVLLTVMLSTSLLTAIPLHGQQLTNTRVTISVEKIPLGEALLQLRTSAGISFVFNPAELKPFTVVNKKFNRETVGNILQHLLLNTGLSFRESANHIAVFKPVPQETTDNAAPAAYQQGGEFQLKGRVVNDRDNTAIPFVNIKIENSTRGVIGDGDGNFQLKVKAGDILIISSMGFLTQKIKAGGESQLTIRLAEDVKGMDEVVVVAYGEQKKVSVTGAIATVRTRELKQSPVANLNNALAGRLPGLITVQRSGKPGADQSQLYIRGVSTLSAGNAAPLIVVDGVEGRAFSDIEPGDVDAVTILKDATATAIYGIRGANGVVLVTTRRGSATRAPSISFTAQRAIQKPTRLFEVVNSYEYATLYNEALRNEGLAEKYSPADLDGYKNHTDPYKYPDNNFADLLLRSSSAMDRYNLTISGGSPFARFFISGTYLGQDGIYKNFPNAYNYKTNTRYNRANFRANVDIDVTKSTVVRLDLSGSFGQRNEAPYDNDPFFSIVRFTPNLAPIYNPDGSWGASSLLTNNPVAELADKGYAIYYNGYAQGFFSITQKLDHFLKGLSASANISYDANYSQTQTRSKNYFAYALNPDGTVNKQPVRQGGKLNPVAASYGLDRFTTFQGRLNYARKFGEDHNVTGLLLYTQTKRFSGGALPFALQGISGRGTYDFRSKYFAEFTFGYNGSENFIKGRRFGFFPAFSAGWLVSEEHFMKGATSFLDYLKIRGSYGVVGNDQLGGSRFLFQSYYADGGGGSFGNPPNGTSGINEGYLGNEMITWEKGYKSNIGIETKFLHNKLRVNVDLFHENRRDILINANTLPDFTGFPNNPPLNKGRVINKGFEAEASYSSNIGKNFTWMIRGNMQYNRNRIEEMDEPTPKYPYLAQTGQRVGQNFGLIAEGFFRNQEEIDKSPKQTFVSVVRPGDIKYKDVNNDGVVDVFDQVPIGYAAIPEIQYGITLSCNYKNFDFSMLIQGAANSSVYLSGWGIFEFYQLGTAMKYHLDRWTPETAGTATWPRLSTSFNANNHRISTMMLKSGDYVRLKNLEIGYSLPQQVLKRVGLSNLRVFANGQNLLTWDKLKVTDPEYASGGIRSTYPQQLVYNFGFTLDF